MLSLLSLRLFRELSPSQCLRKFVQKRFLTTAQSETKDLIETSSSSLMTKFDEEFDVDVHRKSDGTDADLLAPDGRIPLDSFAPYFTPTFNFAAYVNKSSTLQELVKLGVNLHVWEKKKGIPNFVLKLDFERDIKLMIRFLHDQGVPADNLGDLITKNPLIFKENIEDLQVRINYLDSKKFTPKMIQRVITNNPFWLMFSTARIDRRLGHFQRTFQLTGEDVRALSTKLPRLITYNMENIREVTFAVQELMGYEPKEVKALILKVPKLWMMNKELLINRFNYMHVDMGIPHDQILKMPGILKSRLFRIKQRHLFLQECCAKVPEGTSRYDPKNIGYVSLDALASGNDAEFCRNVAKVSIETFNAFLKSL